MGLNTVEVWSAFLPYLQQEGMPFLTSLAPLCARGQMIRFSNPASHMPMCSLKDVYQACIKECYLTLIEWSESKASA